MLALNKYCQRHLGNDTGVIRIFPWMCIYLCAPGGRASSFTLRSFATTCVLLSSKSTLQCRLTQRWLSLCTSVFMTSECGRDVTWSDSLNVSIQNCCLEAFSVTLVWRFPRQWFIIAVCRFCLLSFC